MRFQSRIRWFVIGGLMAVAACLAGPAAAGTVHLVAFGDSLTAGYGIGASEAFPAVLEKALRDRGLDVRVTNAGVSGDTVSAGAQRLDWSVQDGTDGVILALGANDALRGIDPKITREGLERILARLGERKIPVLLAGMYAPRNLGADYVAAFDAIYPELAKKHGVMLYPFFLDGVAQNTRYNQGDGMHPNAEGVRIIVDRMLPTVEAFLRRIAGGT